MECSFDNSSEKIAKKGEKIFAQCPKMINNSHVHQKSVFLKLFLWTCRMQFRQPLQKFVVKRPKIPCSNTQNDIKIQEGCFLSYCHYAQVENSFDNIAEIVPLKSRSYLAQSPKIVWNFHFSRKKILFSSKCSYGDVKWSSDGTAENFPTKGEKFSSQCAKMNRKYTFFRKFSFPPTVPMDK